MKKINQLIQLLFITLFITSFTACKSDSTKLVNDLEKCLGNVKTNDELKKLPKEQVIEIAKCMFPHLEIMQNKLSMMKPEEMKKASQEFLDAIDKSDYKQVLVGINYNDIKKLATGDLSSNESNTPSSTVSSSPVHNFTGTVDKYPVEMTINDESSDITGTYRYKSKSASLNLKGTKDGDKLTMNEYDEKGNKSGSFVGKWVNGTYEGQWTNATETRLMNFKLVEEKQTSSNDNNISVTSSDNSTLTASGSEDWDKFLDQYEEYTDQYIKFYKKAQAGDKNALAEYPSMMDKTLQFEKSLTKAKQNNNLSSSQMSRMLKIQSKLTDAAADAAVEMDKNH